MVVVGSRCQVYYVTGDEVYLNGIGCAGRRCRTPLSSAVHALCRPEELSRVFECEWLGGELANRPPRFQGSLNADRSI
jgi:hypothetical protein